MPELSFPPRFLWGSATSSYQIEGATREDGRVESIWDRFCRVPGAVEDGSTGDVACDHYHRWREDVALMKDLGLHAYRFSVAWPRILSEGGWRVNHAGLDLYSRLVDELLRNDIEPFVTLYHWDLPQVLQDQGGWVSRATGEACAEYADVVSHHLGDRVKNWITHNEPWCTSILGYQIGRHAPGLRDWPAALASAHHVLLSHGWAVPVIRTNSPGSEVGIALNLKHVEPASPSGADSEACRHFDGYFNRWFLDPLHGRDYPADMVADYAVAGHLPSGGMSFVRPGDLETIAVATDFLGVNYYDRAVVRSQDVPEDQNEARTVVVAPESEWTNMGWEVYPDGLCQLLERLHREYRPPKLYITENGASYDDGPDGDGIIDDERRQRYLRDHFVAAHRAISAGVPLSGFFVWSLMDNFEWDRGYTQRFGIVWVDYDTQKRIPKRSARWYQSVVARGSISTD